METQQFKTIVGNLSTPIVVQRVYVKLLDSFTAAVFLSQVIYWETKMGGEFYRQQKLWEDEDFLTADMLRLAIKKCKRYVNVIKKGIPSKNYYSVNWSNLLEDMNNITPHTTSGGESGIASDRETQQHSITENTQRNDVFEAKTSSFSEKEGKDTEIIGNIDEDGNEITVNSWGRPLKQEPRIKKEGKNQIALRIQRHFSDMYFKEFKQRPIDSSIGYKSVCRALDEGFTENEIYDLFENWFATGQDTGILIQITRALSINQLNVYKGRK